MHGSHKVRWGAVVVVLAAVGCRGMAPPSADSSSPPPGVGDAACPASASTTPNLPVAPVSDAAWGVDYGAGGPEPDWRALRDAGVRFVYLKASKSTIVEPDFQAWWKHAGACFHQA